MQADNIKSQHRHDPYICYNCRSSLDKVYILVASIVDSTATAKASCCACVEYGRDSGKWDIASIQSRHCSKVSFPFGEGREVSLGPGDGI